MTVKSKLFKKCSPNGQVYVYLGKREFVSCDGQIDKISGIAHILNLDQLQGKHVFANLVTVFRYGREEDETMGVSFCKELCVDQVQIYPGKSNPSDLTKLQDRLIKKIGGENALPFTLSFPQNSPNSVLIMGDNGDLSSMGIMFQVRIEVHDQGKPIKKQSVAMAIRKVQWLSIKDKQRSPTIKVDKSFFASKGKLELEGNLPKEIFCHGEELPIQITVRNNSKKSVKCIRVSVIQHCELTLTSMQYKTRICYLETKDGCPLNCGSTLDRTFSIKPLAQLCSGERGLVLDASLSKARDETNFASSSIAESGDSNDLLGAVVSYSIKIKLVLSGMGGELDGDLPFKLVHPRPNSGEASKLDELKRSSEKKATEQRRSRFQGQDSVVAASFNVSQEEQ